MPVGQGSSRRPWVGSRRSLLATAREPSSKKDHELFVEPAEGHNFAKLTKACQDRVCGAARWNARDGECRCRRCAQSHNQRLAPFPRAHLVGNGGGSSPPSAFGTLADCPRTSHACCGLRNLTRTGLNYHFPPVGLGVWQRRIHAPYPGVPRHCRRAVSF